MIASGKPDVLIVGADSQIGGAVRDQLLAQGCQVLATSRRPGTRDIPFDLAAPAAGLAALPAAPVVLIAAGITDQARCVESDARRINIYNTLLLARHFGERGSRVVFLSTNLVFGGSVARQAATSVYRPLGEYGRQKADVEQALLAGPGPVAICRLSKVIHRDLPLMRAWTAQLAAGTPVRAFSDLMIAPVSLSYVTAFLGKVLQNDARGIFQVSGDCEISYCDLAIGLARRLRASPALVHCVTKAEANVPLAAAPVHPSLDASRVEHEFGMKPQPLDEVLDELAAVLR